jgi:K+-sensing histidine kinase KdpD
MKAKPTSEIQSALAESITDRFKPKLAIVFISIKQGIETIYDLLNNKGNGIPQKILDKIFQPFFIPKPTMQETGLGLGLGLSWSHVIVKAHG